MHQYLIYLRICGFFIPLFIAGNLFAQRYNLKTFSLDEGLAQSQVYCILQDSKGYLWMGTNSGGLCRFDGRNFTTFTKDDGLVNNQVYSILEDHLGRLIIGTYEGISIFDGQNFLPLPDHLNALANMRINRTYMTHDRYIWFCTNNGAFRWDGKVLTTDSKLQNRTVNALLEDRNHNLWFATSGYGVIRLAGQGAIDYKKNNGLSNNNVSSLIEDINGVIWMGTESGITRYVPADTGKLGGNLVLYRPDNEISSLNISCLYQDSSGNIWAGTRKNGIRIIENDYITVFTSQQGLNNDGIFSIAGDVENNIWLGTDGGGLIQYGFTKFSSLSEREGLNHNIVLSICEDRKKKMWFGTYSGVSVYDGLSFKYFNAGNGLSDDKVWSIIQDSKGIIWIGTFGNGIFKYDPERGTFSGRVNNSHGLSSDNVRALYQDSKGSIWVGTGGGINKIDGNKIKAWSEEDGLSNNAILTILEDSRGNIWFGTSGGGVIKMILSGADGTSLNELVNFSEAEGLANNIVLSLAEDKEGYVWCGTYGGVSRIDNLSDRIKKIKTIRKSQGISSNTVYLLVTDNEDDLIIGTNNGIDKLNVEEFNLSGKVLVKHYGKDEGFGGIECNTNAWAKDNEGSIWLGTIKGAYKYNPRQEKQNTLSPRTHITRIRLFFEEVDMKPYTTETGYLSGLPSNLTLPHDKNHLTFDFIGISMTMPEKVRYRFRLIGFDKNWVPVTPNTSATYSNLPPGDYSFEVRAKSANGVWNKQSQTYRFTIRHPYWQTWWFYILCTAGGICLLAGGFYYRVRALQRAKMLLEEKVRMRTVEVEKQKAALEIANAEMKKLSIVAKKTDNFVMIIDKYDIIEWVNDAFVKMLGFNLGEAIGQNVKRLLRGKDTDEKAIRKIERSVIRKEPFNVEILNYRKGGEPCWLDINVTPVLDDKGEIVRYIEVGNDVTHSKRAREALIKSGKQYRTLFEHIGDCIFIYDKETHFFLDCNRVVERVYGYSKEEIRKMKPHQLHPEEERLNVMENINMKNPNIPNNYTHITKDGRQITVTIRSEEIEYEGRRAWLSLVHDITELKQIQQELEKKAKEVQMSYDNLAKVNELLEVKNNNITESLHYARNIQKAILPQMSDIQKTFAGSFLIFRPVEVVSGDIYWYQSLEENKEMHHYIMAVDCPGHGVPGAFMGIIINDLLNSIIVEEKQGDPSKILQMLHSGLLHSRYSGGNGAMGRGETHAMLCKITKQVSEPDSWQLEFAGALRPLLVVKNGKAEEIRADLFGIGDIFYKITPAFTTHKTLIGKGDAIYLVTDGFINQFGGATRTKFKKNRLIELLQEVSSFDPLIQKNKIEGELNRWIGSFEQTDDILVMGIKF